MQEPPKAQPPSSATHLREFQDRHLFARVHPLIFVHNHQPLYCISFMHDLFLLEYDVQDDLFQAHRSS